MNTKKAKQLRKLIYGEQSQRQPRVWMPYKPAVDVSIRSLYKMAKKFYKQGRLNEFIGMLPKLRVEQKQVEVETIKQRESLLDLAKKNFEAMKNKQEAKNG